MPLRWGLLGTARINRLLIPAIRSSARSEVVAVASRTAVRAASYAAEWQIPETATYEGLLARRDIDVVYLPLPNSLHTEWAIRAVEAGKHVLCEKPLALSVAEVDAIEAASRRHNRIVTEGFMYRHHAQTARILGLLADGAIGTLRTITSAFTFMQNREADVRLDPALGGGSLWDIGCYPVSLAQLLAGAPPIEVSGLRQDGATGVDEMFAGTIRFENGVIGQFHCGFRATHQTFLRLVGTGGILDVHRPFRPEPREHLLLTRGGHVEEVVVEGAAIFTDEVADMEDAALGLRPPRIPLGESRMHIATLEALHRAARDGRSALVHVQGTPKES
jgi:D-xylose 1-dehydrogenase (NADP+, D-xylono-1,5-lactone-forming)